MTKKNVEMQKPQVKLPGVLQLILRCVEEVITSCRWLVLA